MLPQTFPVTTAHKIRALGASIVAILLLAATLMAAAQERAADGTDETLRDAAMAQPDTDASAPEQHAQSKNFFFGWVQFDVDPDAPGGVPGFDFADPSAPHGALAAAQPDTVR